MYVHQYIENMALIKLLTTPRPAQEGYFRSNSVKLEHSHARITIEFSGEDPATDGMFELHHSIDNDKFNLVTGSTRLIDTNKSSMQLDYNGPEGGYIAVAFIQGSTRDLMINEINALV